MSLIANFLDVVYSVKPDGTILFVSPQIARYGYRPEEVISRNFFEFITPDCREYVLKQFRESLASGESLPTAFKWQGKDGQFFWIEALGKTVYDESGRPILQVGVARDIAGRMRAEEALADSQRKLRLVTDNINEVFFMFTPDWRQAVYVSPAYQKIWGRPVDSLYQDPRSWMEAIVPEDLARMIAFIEGQARGEVAYENAIEFRIKKPDGSVRWIRSKTYPVWDERGNIYRITGIADDITSRKDAEDALQASGSMLQLVMDNIPQGIFWKDTNSVYQGCNAVFAKSVGVGSPENIRGKTDYEISYTREQADWFRKFDREVITTGQPQYHIIEPFREASGREGWADTNKIPLRDTEGNVVGILGTYQDITERKRTEEALRAREALLNSIFRVAPIGIGLVSNRLIKEANVELCHMLGYAREDLVGRDSRMIYPTHEDYDYVGREKYRQIREMGTGTVETRWQRKDGRIIDVLLSSTPIDPDRSMADTTFTALDISERKQSEAMLRESETKFKTLFEDAGIAIFIADAETGIIIDCNSTAEKLIGRLRAEIIGMHQTLLHPPMLAEQTRKEFQHYINLGWFANYETEVQHKDGRRIPIILNSSLLVINGKKVMMGFFLDNTERKRAGEELSDAKARAELYVDLMGHDITNMHQVALGYLEIARETIPVDESRKELLDKPIEVLLRSARLISNVRKLQRLQESPLRTRMIDVCGMLSDVQREYGSVPDKTITLNLRCNEPCHVLANELLHDVFVNLVGNAIKHTGDPAEIAISLDRVEDGGHRHCRVTVEDNGPGIPDDIKEVVFKRVPKGASNVKGMGLGLYLVKSLTESFNGRVWVEDRVPGDHAKGAMFVVMLPAADQK